MVSVVDAEEVELSDLNSGLIQKKKIKENISSNNDELSLPNETKKIETTPKKALRVVEAFPEVKKEKNLTLKERIEKEIGILKNGIQSNTSLLIGLMEDPKRSLNNPVIVTVRKKLVEKNSKLTKLEKFYSLDDDKIDENMKEKIENLLKQDIQAKKDEYDWENQWMYKNNN